MKPAMVTAIVNGLVKLGKGMFGNEPSKGENRAGTLAAALTAGLIGMGVPDRAAESITDGIVCAGGELVEYQEQKNEGEGNGGSTGAASGEG